jgi:hypothetical protein
MVDNNIKKADYDFFIKDLNNKKKIEKSNENTLNSIGDNIKYINDALDLSNDKIPIKIEKIKDNLYSFKREIPQKIKFSNIDDLMLFISNYKSIDLKAFGIENAKITNISINIIDDIDSINYDLNIIDDIIYIITIFGIPFFINNLYNRYKINQFIKTGLSISISGYISY